MGTESYTSYEAKARFAERMRKVRQGRSIVITYHGEAVAELRPIAREGGTDARIEYLAERGLITPPPSR